uniref:Uncharacterized protein n=1 Tax=Salix viminalis TaxID=40686 RepID=A0A6N2NM05_SALVM
MVAFRFHQYQVVGRALPTENDDHPKIYRMKLWATNEVRSKSKFCLRRSRKAMDKFLPSMRFLRRILPRSRISEYGCDTRAEQVITTCTRNTGTLL